MEAHTQLSVVLGCYNAGASAAARLRRLASFLDSLGRSYEIIVVDDGSEDGSFATLHRLRTEIPQLAVYRNPVNRGKGFSIRRGVRKARGELVLFTDVDFAYGEPDLLALIRTLDSGWPVVVGNRRLPDSVYTANNRVVRYVYRRHRIGSAFNLVVRLLFGIDTRDTQSGLKGFHARAARRIFPRIRTDRFLFDIEIFIRARILGIPVREIPVHVTYEDDESTVRQAWEFVRLLPELLRIKTAELRGLYDGEELGPAAGPALVSLVPREFAPASPREEWGLTELRRAGADR